LVTVAYFLPGQAKDSSAPPHNPIALCNLTCTYKVVSQGGRRLSAYKMIADQSEPGGHVRSADEEPRASDLSVVHREEAKSSDHIPGFLILA